MNGKATSRQRRINQQRHMQVARRSGVQTNVGRMTNVGRIAPKYEPPIHNVPWPAPGRLPVPPIIACPVCEAKGSDPCVTSSGKPAKSNHKARVNV